jgi:hypothetical protein
MVFELEEGRPLLELARNRNYFGADIRDRDAGIITQTKQFLQHRSIVDWGHQSRLCHIW